MLCLFQYKKNVKSFLNGLHQQELFSDIDIDETFNKQRNFVYFRILAVIKQKLLHQSTFLTGVSYF